MNKISNHALKMQLMSLLFAMILCSCVGPGSIMTSEPQSTWEFFTEIVETEPVFNYSGIKKVAIIRPNVHPQTSDSKLLAESNRLTSFLTEKLVKIRIYGVVERELIEKLMKELGLSESGWIDPATQVKLGKFAGADAMVLGNLYFETANSKVSTIDLRFVDVSTSKILWTETYPKFDDSNLCRNSSELALFHCCTEHFTSQIAPGKKEIKKRRKVIMIPQRGEVPAGYIGVIPYTSEEMKKIKFTEFYGVLIRSVVKDSPAYNAGIIPGDIIKTIDGERIWNRDKLFSIVEQTPVGKVITVEVVRNERKVKFNIKTEEYVLEV